MPNLLTVSRPELLFEGSDAEVRDTLHGIFAQGEVLSELADEFGAALGITGVQHHLLTAVQRKGGVTGISVTELAGYLHRSGAFVTIESGKLVKLGLMHKRPDKHDRRLVRLSLSDEGHRRLADLAALQRTVNDMIFAGFSSEQFRVFAANIQAVLANAEQARDRLKYEVVALKRSAA